MGYAKVHFSQETIKQANEVNIIMLAQNMGYQLKRVSPKAFKIPDHGGLFIDADGSRWHCFSQEAGGGPIQFLMHIKDITWAEAVEELSGSRALDCSPKRSVQSQISDQKEKEAFSLPPKGKTMKHVFAYLIGNRGIEKSIVYDMVKQGLVYENDKNSCVFVGKDECSVPRHASIRSTSTFKESFRMDVRNSDKAYCFNIPGNSGQLFVFESPIDLMSYMSIARKVSCSLDGSHMLALGGVSDKALIRYLKAHKEIKDVILCLDNDEAGRRACQTISNCLRGNRNVSIHLPQRKDWNDDLLAMSREESDRESQEELIHQ